MSLADAHVHLSDAAFCEDVDDVMARARDSGVSLVVNVTTTKNELDTSFAYAERFSYMRFVMLQELLPGCSERYRR